MIKHNGVVKLSLVGMQEEAPLLLPPAWTKQASCRNAEKSLFFPSKRRKSGCDEVIEQYCSVCPVLAKCGQFGIDTGSEGIWGGKWLSGRVATAQSRTRVVNGKWHEMENAK